MGTCISGGILHPLAHWTLDPCPAKLLTILPAPYDVLVNESRPFHRVFPLAPGWPDGDLGSDESIGGDFKRTITDPATNWCKGMMSDPWAIGAAGFAVGSVSGAVGLTVALRRRFLHRWIIPYLLSTHRRRAPKLGQPVDVLLAICDHFEPKRGNAKMETARKRVRQWVEEYPRLFGRFRDSDGLPPQHTFFYPADEYEPELLDMIAGICRHKDGNRYGEVEIHLHHDN